MCLDHPYVLLGLVIRVGHPEIMDEQQYSLPVLIQSFQQISGFALLDSTPFFRVWSRGKRIFGQSSSNHFIILRFEVGDLLIGQSVLPYGDGRLHGIVHLMEKLNQVAGPQLFVIVDHGIQFAFMVDIAQRVLTGIAPIRGPAVMDGDPGVGRQDACVIHPHGPSLWMDRVAGQFMIARAMEPVVLAFHPQSGFIKVKHRNCEKLFLHAGFIEIQLRVQHLIRIVQRALTDGMAREVEQQFGQAFQWNQLIYAAVAEETFESRAILDLERGIGRKRGLIAMMTVRTAEDLCPMF